MQIDFAEPGSANIIESCNGKEIERLSAFWQKQKEIIIVKVENRSLSLFVASLCRDPSYGCGQAKLLNMSKVSYLKYLSFELRNKNS